MATRISGNNNSIKTENPKSIPQKISSVMRKKVLPIAGAGMIAAATLITPASCENETNSTTQKEVINSYNAVLGTTSANVVINIHGGNLTDSSVILQLQDNIKGADWSFLGGIVNIYVDESLPGIEWRSYNSFAVNVKDVDSDLISGGMIVLFNTYYA
jgi:hypothetical protein